MTDDDGRRVLFWEGVPTTDGRFIQPDAVHWNEDPIPVVLQPKMGELPAEIHGKLTEVRREDDGRVTGRVDPPLPPGYHLAPTFVALSLRNRGIEDEDAHTLVIQRARLAAVVVQDHTLWPEQ